MKKRITSGIILLFLLTFTNLCYAGSIPEDLLGYYMAQVYFGEVVKIDGESITVVQRQNIKGEFEKGNQITYRDYAFTKSPRAGEIYLCGYFDENNPLYVWETTCLETKSLKIKNKDDLSKRMQEYLNKGLFDKKEQERLKSIGMVTTSDGQEQSSDFDAVGNTDYTKFIIRSIILIVLATFFVFVLRKKQS
jgi:hypothetical protein